jgi:hypothetical protein
MLMHTAAFFTNQQYKSSHLPDRIPCKPEEFQTFIAAASFAVFHAAVLVLVHI